MSGGHYIPEVYVSAIQPFYSLNLTTLPAGFDHSRFFFDFRHRECTGSMTTTTDIRDTQYGSVSAIKATRCRFYRSISINMTMVLHQCT